MAALTPAQLDAQVMALEGLLSFRRWDESIPDTFSGLIPSANLFGLAQSAPPSANTDGGGASSVAYADWYGAYSASATTSVPGPFVGDASTKDYYYGGVGKAGTTSGSITAAADTILLSQVRVSHAGSAVAVVAFLDGSGSGTGSQVCRAVLYDDNGSDVPGTLRAESSEVTVTDGQAYGLVTFTFVTPYTLPTAGPSGKYWVGIHFGSNTNTIRLGNASNSGVLRSALSLTDTYSGGASSSYVGSSTTTGSYIIGLKVQKAVTAISADFSSHPASTYIDSLDDRISHGEDRGRGINVASPFSLGGWVRVTTMPTGGTADRDRYHGVWGISQDIGSGDTGYGLLIEQGGALHFWRLGGGDSTSHWNKPGYFVSSASGLISADGEWHHIVCRANGATLEIFLDGVLVASKTDATVPASWSAGAQYANIPTDFSISGQAKLLRGYLHRTWVTQSVVTDEFISEQQGLGAITLDAMTCDDLTMVASSCDTLSMTGQTADTPTLEPMVCD